MILVLVQRQIVPKFKLNYNIYVPWGVMMNTVWSRELLDRIAVVFISPTFRTGILNNIIPTSLQLKMLQVHYFL